MATDYLLQEDGTSKLILEDASGDLILESSTPVAPSGLVRIFGSGMGGSAGQIIGG